MLIIPLLVAGTIVYAGFKSLTPDAGFMPRTLPLGAARTSVAVTAAAGPSPSSAAARPTPQSNAATRKALRRHQLAASAALGLAAGSLAVPSLSIVSIPLILYSSVPILETGFYAIRVERKFKFSAATSVLIVITLLTRQELAAAAMSWLYHTAQRIKENTGRMASEVFADVSNRVLQVTGNPPLTVWRAGDSVEVQIPFTEVAAGDIIVVQRGDVIPLDGVVTSGSATVNMFFRTGSATLLAVQVGDPVYARSLVTDGQMYIRIE